MSGISTGRSRTTFAMTTITSDVNVTNSSRRSKSTMPMKDVTSDVNRVSDSDTSMLTGANFSCDVCTALFSTKSNFKRHMRHFHSGTEELRRNDENNNTFPCGTCSYKAASRENLRKHLQRRKHQKPAESEPKPRSGCVICPICSASMELQQQLVNHVQNEHEVQTHSGTLEFLTQEEFYEWKKGAEKSTITSWTTVSKKSTNTTTKTYYKCSRSGATRSRSTGKRRPHAKTATRNCSSYLVVVEQKDRAGITVNYCTTHVGHALSVAHLPLSVEDRNVIATFLRQRFPIRSITRAIRSEFKDPSLRLYWISMMDVRNVAVQLGLQPGKRHENDFESVRLRVQENTKEDGIQMYTEPSSSTASDFCLIIITPLQEDYLKRFSDRGVGCDDTHNTSRYNLKLLIMTVVDACGRGWPVGFMLSSKMTVREVEKFFEVVKGIYPSFKPEAFVTDDTPVFWNAFSKVFPVAARTTRHLLCAWHVKRAVFTYLKREFPSGHTATRTITEHLDVLFIESNKPRWQRALTYFLGLLGDLQLNRGDQRMSKAAENFEKYIRTRYLPRREEWAPYSRIFAIMNTNMYNERFNKTIKYDYLNRSENSRIDFVVQELIDSVNDLFRARLTSDVRDLTHGKSRITQTIQRHTVAAKAIEHNAPAIERLGPNRWKVPSTDASNSRYYFITNRECSCKTGKFQDKSYCPLCGVCPHCVSCSCPDGRKSGIACKHSHIWWMLHDEESPLPVIEEVPTSEPGFVAVPSNDPGGSPVVELSDAFVDTVKEKCLEAHRNIELILDSISRCSLRSSRASTPEDLHKLEEATTALKGILSLWEDGGSSSLLPMRRKLSLTGRPTKAEKQLRGGKSAKQFTTMEKRSAALARKKDRPRTASIPHPELIPDSEIHVCALCERVEPEGEGEILWFQCDNNDCRVWAHLECVHVRECAFCETGIYQATGDYENSDNEDDHLEAVC